MTGEPPDADELLRDYIARLYVTAKMPSARQIEAGLAAAWPATTGRPPPSHTTVHRIIRHGRGGLEPLQAVVRFLGGDVRRATRLWTDASTARRQGHSPIARHLAADRIADGVERIADAVEAIAAALGTGTKKRKAPDTST
jgi:hypothetical protein